MTSRERVLNAMNFLPVDRPPFSFWFHFLKDESIVNAVKNPDLLEQSYQGHSNFINEVKPDFVKIMSDGLFHYPGIDLGSIKRVADLNGIREPDDNDPWIIANVKHVSRVVALNPDLCYFYNIFSPSMLLRIFTGEEKYFALYHEDKIKLANALVIMGRGISKMVTHVLMKSGADGIFFCAQNTNIHRLSDEEYATYFRPSDHIVLDSANALKKNNILHVCGYEGRRNNLEQWSDYKCKAVNWACNVEKVSLSEGKHIFKNRAAIGGFDNTINGALYIGIKQQIEDITERIVNDFGKIGLLVAADCSLPYDINPQHLIWVREKLESIYS